MNTKDLCIGVIIGVTGCASFEIVTELIKEHRRRKEQLLILERTLNALKIIADKLEEEHDDSNLNNDKNTENNEA